MNQMGTGTPDLGAAPQFDAEQGMDETTEGAAEKDLAVRRVEVEALLTGAAFKNAGPDVAEAGGSTIAPADQLYEPTVFDSGHRKFVVGKAKEADEAVTIYNEQGKIEATVHLKTGKVQLPEHTNSDEWVEYGELPGILKLEK